MNQLKGARVKISMARLVLLALAAAVVPACGGSGGAGSGGLGPVSFSPGPGFVGGTPGIRTIVTRGGTGSVGAGGAGGAIVLENSAGGDAMILETGSVNAEFALPSPTINLGPNPRTITADTIYTLGAPSTTTLTGGVFTMFGDDNATIATGLRVAVGVTLTLPCHWDALNGDGLFDGVGLVFSHGVDIAGTFVFGKRDLAVPGDGGSPNGALTYFQSRNFVVRSSGSLNTSGANVPGGTGGTAGQIYLDILDAMMNSGTLTATGGNGDTGGNGAPIELDSTNYGVYNTGSVNSSGGTGAVANGGGASFVTFNGSKAAGSFTGGGVFNSGNVTARGGNGATGGGFGNGISLSLANSDGPTFCSGTLDSSGGNALTSGNGGPAGGQTLFARGGQIRLVGTILSKGGTGATGGNGGSGGPVTVESDTQAAQPVTDGLFLWADIDTRGGNGDIGGPGGTLTIKCRSDLPVDTVRPGLVPLLLAGTISFDSTGGTGATSGGGGGACTMRNLPATSPGGNPYLGSFLNEADLTTRGGTGTSTFGGGGGAVTLGSQVTVPASLSSNFNRTNVNKGVIDTRGGDGATGGGNGGPYSLLDLLHASNQAAVTCSGGQGGSGTGGTGGQIRISTDGDSINNGALVSDGGGTTGAGAGGLAGQIFVEGSAAQHSGTISARGGNSAAGAGGNGRAIEIGSWNGITLSTVVGTLGVQAGTGATPGVVGIVTIDGIRVVLINGSVTY